MLDADTTLATEDGLLELLRETERLRNRLAALDHAVILEVETRGVPQAHAASSRLINIVLETQGVTHYSSSHRIFTENQRLAMIARDRGCSFPGCDTPPQWCDSHHVTPWHETKHTTIDNGTLCAASTIGTSNDSAGRSK